MYNIQNFGQNNMNQNMDNIQFSMNNQMNTQNLIQNQMINHYSYSLDNINPYMNQNYNNMVLNNQMNQNFMNGDNNNNNDLNNYNLDEDKKELINSIIEFFKENNILCINFEYPNQIKALINLLNENYSGFKYENEVKDPLFYLKGPKIMIKFINSNFEVKKVKIPKLTITKYDLYTIANLYKYFFNNNKILLIHKNKILNKDESPIDFISDNDNIIIIEPRYFPDDSYYKSLMKKSSNDFRNVILNLYYGNILHRSFPSDITFGEMCKAFYLILGSSNYEYLFLKYDEGFRIDPNDKRKLKEFVKSLSLEERGKGGIITAHIKVLGKQINFTINSNSYNYIIGILNKIEDIIIYYEPIEERKVKSIKIGEIEIKRDEDKRLCSLLSLGITKDFKCQIEFEERII